MVPVFFGKQVYAELFVALYVVTLPRALRFLGYVARREGYRPFRSHPLPTRFEVPGLVTAMEDMQANTLG